LKKKIIFDFDGVICDSTLECLYIAYNSYSIINSPNNYNFIEIDQIDEGFKKKFFKYRSYIKGASQFYNLIKMIKEKSNFHNIENELSVSTDNNILFSKIFYEQRISLKERNIDKWFNLHDFNLEILNFLKEYSKNQNILIATLKDSSSVLSLLDYKGINIEQVSILDKDKIKTKLEAVKKFSINFNFDIKDAIFFDDNVYHLLPIHEEGIETYLISWFYKNDYFIDYAKNNNIQTITKFDQFLNFIK
jgi:FMN phosphatase YigB (HAD superfamily)